MLKWVKHMYQQVIARLRESYNWNAIEGDHYGIED